MKYKNVHVPAQERRTIALIREMVQYCHDKHMYEDTYEFYRIGDMGNTKQVLKALEYINKLHDSVK